VPWLTEGEGAASARGLGPVVRAGTEVPLGAPALVAGALGTGVGLVTTIGLGVGVGRTGARMIGLSVSTGPCERGLVVGRAPGIEKSGTDWVWATSVAGTSASPSAKAPVAALTVPPNILIDLSIFPASAR
jgi:hypothetical protein